jgi:hypothetical protein
METVSVSVGQYTIARKESISFSLTRNNCTFNIHNVPKSAHIVHFEKMEMTSRPSINVHDILCVARDLVMDSDQITAQFGDRQYKLSGKEYKAITGILTMINGEIHEFGLDGSRKHVAKSTRMEPFGGALSCAVPPPFMAARDGHSLYPQSRSSVDDGTKLRHVLMELKDLVDPECHAAIDSMKLVKKSSTVVLTGFAFVVNAEYSDAFSKWADVVQHYTSYTKFVDHCYDFVSFMTMQSHCQKQLFCKMPSMVATFGVDICHTEREKMFTKLQDKFMTLKSVFESLSPDTIRFGIEMCDLDSERLFKFTRELEQIMTVTCGSEMISKSKLVPGCVSALAHFCLRDNVYHLDGEEADNYNAFVRNMHDTFTTILRVCANKRVDE